MNIVGIFGLAGAGKDTAADRLVSNHGYTKVSLADPLKRISRDVYGFTDTQLWGPSSARNAPDKRYVRERHERHDWVEASDGEFECSRCQAHGQQNPDECVVYLTARFALQVLGTEWGRTCYKNTWTDLAIKTARAILEQGMSYTPQRGLYTDDSGARPSGVAIADMRFWNELESVKEAGGYVWRIKPPAPLVAAEGWRKHQSETEQGEIPDSAFHQVIVNRKVAFETLYADVDEALARCLKAA